MKLKYTIILVSLATPLVTVAETDCLQDKNKNLYEIISCLNQRGIDNVKVLIKDNQRLRKENKREIEKANALIRQLKSELRQLKSELAKKEKVFPPKFFRDRLKNGGFGPKMVLIPAGSFRMGDIQGGGSSNEQPVHSVYVNKFAMGKFEVTFAEYDKFAEATGRSKPNDGGWGRGNRPVINVSWHDATAYTEWLSNQTGKKYRLPTEAEWEYAARAGTETKYWWGNDIDKSKANYSSNLSKTSPVGDYKPNPFDLYDTSGNVWEWTCSEYEDKYNGKEKTCINKNSNKYRVLRGGSWGSLPWYVRAAIRSGFTPGFRFGNSGFRVVVMAAAWTK